MESNLLLRIGVVCLAMLMAPAFVFGTIITVRQDGTGDYLTITDACAAAMSGDTIDVGPGTYPENVEIGVGVTIFGSAGAGATILDGEGSHRILNFLSGSSGSDVSGFTLTGAYAGSGGALLVNKGSIVHVSDCLFVDNYADYDGSAFYVGQTGNHLIIEDCTFIGNHSLHNGGAGIVIQQGILDVARCVFHDNTCDIYSAGLAAHYAEMNVADCLFYENASGNVAGALYYNRSTGLVSNNTFDGNTSPGGDGLGDDAGTVYVNESPDVVVERNIITNDHGLCGLWDRESWMSHTCNVYYGNVGGAVGGDGVLDPTEIVADPLYCDAPAADYTIAYESPAAPANNPCGVLIGAYGPACHAAPHDTYITVRQDGTGDYLTITEAHAAAWSGDTIDVGPGTYPENISIEKRLTIFGSSGADVTVLDGEGSHLIMYFIAGSSGSDVSGFTFTDGYGSNGGAVRVQDGSEVHIGDCRFEDNYATNDGSAFFVRHAGSHLTIEDCTFVGNHSIHNGGAGNIIEPGILDVTRCVFHLNMCDTMSAGLAAHYAEMNVADCLFYENTSGNVAGALYYYRSTGLVSNNTFDGNTSPGGDGLGDDAGTVYVNESPGVVVERNIITNDHGLCGLWDRESWMTHTCNVYYGNVGGAVGGDGVLGPTEMVADPLYCDAPAADYTIAYESPAAPGNNPCGVLIGAYGPACHAAPHDTYITVRQDGTGDYLTITEAHAAAWSGDTIDVGPGTYPENISIEKRLTIFGSSGADVTVLDGEGSHLIMYFIAGSFGSDVSGFTFTNGYGSNGGAVRVQDGNEVHIGDCRFENNYAANDGSAFFVRHAGSHLVVEDCTFVGNHSVHNGGAGNIIEPGILDVTRCVFHLNVCDTMSAGLAAHYAEMNVADCLFYENASGNVAGALYYYRSTGLVSNNTFDGNTSPGGDGLGDDAGTVYVNESPDVVVERNIITNDHGLCGLWDRESWMTHTCNVYYGNVGGAVGGDGVLDPMEMVADPLYCDAPAADYTIAYESPAAPGNNPCGVLIGAYGPACHREPPPVGPVILSITDIPNDQGRQVRIIWERSIYDARGSSYTITGYGIYRREPASAACIPGLPPVPDEREMLRGAMLVGWDYVVTVPARGDSIYQTVVPTLCDSTINDGMCWSVFFVSAMTEDPLTYWDSAPDSGYSVDNLPPCTPGSFLAEQQGNDMRLGWDENTESDFAFYRLWKVDVPGPLEGHLLIETTDLSFVDSSWDPGEQALYSIEAVDVNGNVSEPAVLMPDDFIATLLLDASVSRVGDAVVVNWTLSRDSETPVFMINRAVDDGDFTPLVGAHIVREGTSYTFTDHDTEPGRSYRYRVEYKSGALSFVLFETERFTVPPLRLVLFQNHPNPFNPTTRIAFDIDREGHVSLVIYDISGALIHTLVDRTMRPGSYSEEWDGRNASGGLVASGVYFYRLIAGSGTLTRKAVLLR